ncbi:CRAL-TRIO domain-containing protein [Stachybotrys elegans]|uniref:Phosphatidylinositol transfer protein SFH5 n=1 Tax=Stachybotrys elegans TaxID=80388 RepID=A0A8K0SGC6_9HYPO|nr:CRAL-TRIO domain-containing protein [Stachybotrys elegans]
MATTPESPLKQLAARLPEILKKAEHTEMWGVELKDLDHAPTQVILHKFLAANTNVVANAEQQLISALEWRKQVNPAGLTQGTYSKSKFDNLGFVTVHKNEGETAGETVITWNIYGAVEDKKHTFGDIEEFIKWRAALMELGVQKLKLGDITKPIEDGAEDPYQMVQVHDYLSVSFLRMDPAVKAATRETIRVMSMAYPELLSHKYFVNVPAIMGWMYAAMKLILAPATLRKFHPMADGKSLVAELPGIKSSLPIEYGGQGPSVKEGLAVALADEKEDTTAAPAKETTAEEATPEEAPAQEAAPAATETKEVVAEKDATPAVIEADAPKPAEETPKPADETVKAMEQLELTDEKPADDKATSEAQQAAEAPVEQPAAQQPVVDAETKPTEGQGEKKEAA